MESSEPLELIKRASKHAKEAAELLTEATAVPTFEDQKHIDPCAAASEIRSLSRKFEMEIGHAMVLLEEYLRSRQTAAAEKATGRH